MFGVSGVPVLCAVACHHTRTDTQQGHSTVQGNTTQSYENLFFFLMGSVLDDSSQDACVFSVSLKMV